MGAKTYTVAGPSELHLGPDEVYLPGETVELTREAAAPLLADGVVAPEGARKKNPPPKGARKNDPPPEGARKKNPPPKGARKNDPPPEGARKKNPPPEGARKKDPPPARPEGDELQAAIRGAIEALDPNNPRHFTKGGKPEVKALEARLDFDISAAERDEAWTAVEATRRKRG